MKVYIDPKILEESRTVLKSLIEESPIGYAIFTNNGKILAINESMANLLGYEAEKLINKKDYSEFFFNPGQIQELKKLIELNGAIKRYELILKHKNGSAINTLISVVPIRKNAEKTYWHVIIENITKRKQIEEELLKAQKIESLEILASGIAHDFNNILTAIMGNISIAKANLKIQDTTYERLIEAEKAIQIAKNLTQKLLIFSRGEEPNKKPIKIEELIQDSIALSLSNSLNISINVKVHPESSPILGDKEQILQVLNNILINAKQAMPSGGNILLEVENTTILPEDFVPLPQGKYVKISVRDEGDGIAMEHLDKIFDPYFSTKSTGSGLGLFTAYSIVKKHGGHISVESNIGKGSKFIIYLPASQITGEEKSPDAPSVQKTNTKRVLVMDDQLLIRRTLKSMLELLGYEVILSETAEETIEKFKLAYNTGKPFDVVLLDLNTGAGMDGRETLQKLLAVDPMVKAIATSGYPYDPVISNYSKYGFCAAISKPYTLEQLENLMHSIVHTQQQGKSSL